VQIIENRFKPTNMYRLLASEKDLAESQRTISISGVEFEQAERDGRESEHWMSEHRMSGFFKAWAAYTSVRASRYSDCNTGLGLMLEWFCRWRILSRKACNKV